MANFRHFGNFLSIAVQEIGQLGTKEKVQKIDNFVRGDEPNLRTDCDRKGHHEDAQRLDTQIDKKTH
jgi:hypothetical protein